MDYSQLIAKNIFLQPNMAVDCLDQWINQNYFALEVILKSKSLLVYDEEKQIGILNCKGIIGFNITEENIDNALNELKNKKECKGLLIKVNSPGGSAIQSDAIDDLLVELKKETKLNIVAYVEDMAASAGYRIAARADKIVARKSSYIGSIGSISIIPDCSKAFENAGIKMEIFRSGKYKSWPTNYESLDEEGKNKLMAEVKNCADRFIASVSSARKIDKTEIENWAGSIFEARKAKELKLIDYFGSEQKAISLLTGSPQKPLGEQIEESEQEDEIEEENIPQLKTLDPEPVSLKSNDSNMGSEMTKELEDKVKNLETQLGEIKNSAIGEYKIEYQKAYGKAPAEDKIKVLSSCEVGYIKSEIEDLKSINKNKFQSSKNKVIESTARANNSQVDFSEESEDLEQTASIASLMFNKIVGSSSIAGKLPGFERSISHNAMLAEIKGGIQ